MEENKNTTELDAFAKKYVKEIHTESPSADFTASLMGKIVVEHQKSVFKSKALISKKVWFLLFALLIALLFIPFKKSEERLLHIPRIDFSFLDKIQMSNLFEIFSVSNTVTYAICFFGLMFMAQVVFLKNYFNKRFE
tara:strand:- start:67 stop:477 length:411 start_codon:yes stop_codon:yes gene_type:complete